MNNKQSQLNMRLATLADVDSIIELVKRAYPQMSPYMPAMIRGQINAFPEGVWIAELGGEIVGYCATIRLPEKEALGPHTWNEITGGGYGSTHDPDGEYLYGYEVCVDPAFRRYRIGQRFYRARRHLVESLSLKGIVIAGRMPNYARRRKEYPTPEHYLEATLQRKVRDPVIGFQVRNGFEAIGVLPGYLPVDTESLGNAVHMVWRNPHFKEEERAAKSKTVLQGLTSDRVRIASVQYGQRRIHSFDEFRQMTLYFIDVCADYRADFVVFPELYTLQLLSIENEPIPPNEAIRHITEHEGAIMDFVRDAAIRYNINIIAGSTPSLRGDAVYNVAHVFKRDGTHQSQDKIHPTPNESYWWNIMGGDEVKLIESDCGPVAVLVCYDVEFPELARHLTDQGVNVLFVPFLTDERQSYLRVRYCAQARAVENQIYVAMSGSCGNLPNVHNMDIHYAQSCILTPCDFPFDRDGIAADTTPNVEMVAFADLSLRDLRSARHSGTVRNLRDRRHDLYSVVWRSER
ncbi:MAG: GNAT family N-acetyltransferase [Gammaproteobacteria bacterium]|nr:GNAT family N-acetyltransferase [Gammaproteobacteria bacterium]MDH3506203.1 GNAT family N-acetyltransferase [Gammaproteobacteria bacterium]